VDTQENKTALEQKPANVLEGYCVVIIPSQAALDTLQLCNAELAKKYGGPVFKPHLTVLLEALVPEDELLSIVESVAKTYPAPLMRFNEVCLGSVFYKCAYLGVEKTVELEVINKSLLDACNMSKPFDPHISLAYGDFSDETLSQIKTDAEAFLTRHPIQDGLASSIEVWKTEGTIDAHHSIASFQFVV
jgi:2'-5' RNA ligase